VDGSETPQEKREIHHSPSLEKLRINLYGEMHPDYKKSSRKQRPNENTSVHTQCFRLLLLLLVPSEWISWER
jgi:hypothetical protein